MQPWVLAGALAGALLAVASGGRAQTLITPDDFLDVAEGKTLTFEDFRRGGQVGIETFVSRTLTVWKQGEDSCVYGRVTTKGRELCFRYDNTPDRVVCWLPFRKGDQLFVRLASFTEVEIQVVSGISTDTIPCANAPVS